MTSKNYLSNKKNVKMSFSTSDALTDWIKRYVSNKKNKEPNDEQYNSVSSFIHSSLEKIMEIFEKGKDLDDFERFIDKNVADFYELGFFRANIIQTEVCFELNKYIPYKKDLLRYFRAYRIFMFENVDFEGDIDKNVVLIIDRFNNFVRENNVTKHLLVTKDGKNFVLEFEGHETNIHFEFSKAFAVVLGVIGMKIMKSSYMSKYTRFDCEADPILFQKTPKIKDQFKLANENMDKFLQYDLLLKDKKEHLWINTSLSMEAMITFNSKKSGIDFIKTKIEKLMLSINPAEINSYILLIFEKFNWITIENEEAVSFSFNMAEDEHEIEWAIVREIFQGKLKSSSEREFYLESRKD